MTHPALVNRETTLKPPLKWAGGKRWLVPVLEKLWRNTKAKRLVEPFCGGLAVCLGLKPEQALLNDVNPHPVNFYKQLQKGLQVKIALRNERVFYDAHRADFNRIIQGHHRDTKKAASLFYYLNRTGYNGLCRFNQKGVYNVPFGRHERINYQRDFSNYQQTLTQWAFQCGDFETIALEADDFVYADPPYDVEFRQYSAGGFDWSSQERLVAWLGEHTGPVVLSNQATQRVIELYQQFRFKIRYLDAPRMISCNGDRTKAREVLATRNL
jgi:DNA adenine methylase